MKYCSRCRFANPDAATFCGRDGTPLPAAPKQIVVQYNQQSKSNKILFFLIGGGVSVIVFLFALMVVAVALTSGIKPNDIAVNNNQSVLSTSQEANSTIAKTTNKNVTNSTNVETSFNTTSRRYTDREYAIYREVISAPISESESNSFKRIGKKYGISPTEVKATAERVMRAVHSVNGRDVEKQIRAALNGIVKVKSVVASADFVVVTYVEESAAWNEVDVKRKVAEGMPKVLAAIFSVSEVKQTQIKAFYPTTNGSDKSIGGVVVERAEFNLSKSAESYKRFWME